uniref:Putative RNA-directed DNA polymerase, eukaryota, reverse transcriptase zinc-binding domain protein n=1 Tax=Tanacetum cinerariifolium TaxID=118510 RepID=A0A6L2KKT3_TANCI|nr:putative RNA-directed DNA polymerase, eukaryota, reverse transcriptase zinc-binding domain protein [Tanacetum cinerariifolium]
MVFGLRCCSWIKECLELTSVSVLVNGSPSKEFLMERGLCQGDPLSPFLFLIGVETLQVTILKACNKNIFKGLSLAYDGANVSILQYTDNAIFFGKWSLRNAASLVKILKCLQDASGLKVNLAKSKIYGIGVPREEVASIACLIHYGFDSLSFIYLGLSIDRDMSKASSWFEVIDSFTRRLSSWKSKCLSIGSRLTLIKAVLGSLPLLPTMPNLSSRSVSVSSTLCNSEIELLDHYLVNCPLVKPVWAKEWSWWGLDLSGFSLDDIIYGSRISFANKWAAKAFRGVTWSLVWSIWKWWNEVVHTSPNDVPSILRKDLFPNFQRVTRLRVSNRARCSNAGNGVGRRYHTVGWRCPTALGLALGLTWPPRVTLGRLLSHARGLGFKPRREGFLSGAKNEWGLSPKAKVRVLHTAQLDVTVSSNH